MGIFNFGKRKKQEREYLLQWQNAVLDMPHDTLVMSRDELEEATKEGAENDLRVIKDCMKLINSTLKPDVFFERLNLMIQASIDLIRYEPYISFPNTTPSEMSLLFNEKYQEYVRSFLLRSYSDTFEKAKTMKTAKGKIGKFKRWYDNIHEHYCFMSDENKQFVESEFRHQTNILTGGE